MLLKKILFIFCTLQLPITYAVDIAKLPVRHTATKAYQIALIEEALLQSQEEYGPYKFITHVADLSSKRTFTELNKDEQKYINLKVGVTSRYREDTSIPIKLPIRKGLLSYKLIIINKKNVGMFEGVDNISALKKFNIGVVYDWVTADILHQNAFDVIESPSYDGLFRMLSAGRFDYTVLGANEAFRILASLESKNLNLMIAPNIALYINTPSYIFVSNKNPRLAERITWGMEKMISNGRFDDIFYQFHQPYIEEANLKNRIVISIPNPLIAELQSPPLFERSELWFDPLK